MRAIVLGAAAGGGFPQWNCGCPNCQAARDGRASPRTQASIALATDGGGWVIVGASPDLRQQILQTPELAPLPGTRNPPMTGVVLVSADIDGIAGLLTLREGHAFRLFAPPSILDVLSVNGVFASLDPSLVERIPVLPGQDLDTRLGLSLRLLTMPGKVPLYQEERGAVEAEPAMTYAARLEADGSVCIVAPACAEITEDVRRDLAEADLLFFDGTLFRDDEMIRAGLGWKTGRRMGHVSLDGAEGTLARLAGVGGRRVLFHINNTNRVLLEDSPERRQAEAAGFEIAHDGMRIAVVPRGQACDLTRRHRS